ncbi:MAG: hypothetical protein Q7K48_04105 [Fusobacterium sp. JB021]|nr:hypothetical protein [Fusobacterium sp. JB020]MDP0493459.1 hypothetical protein [Fusobacterium sp. JB021]MDP0507084.1 hypothetical protein [Fusobacterium sp. JB019]
MLDFNSQSEFLEEKGRFFRKNTYFTLNNNGIINRKEFNNIIPLSVYTDDIQKFINYSMEFYNESEDKEIRKISRMTTEKDEKLDKNMLKLIAKGSYKHVLPYCKEMYFRDENKFFKTLFNYVLMDNMDFNKGIQVYSMREYFKKYGYVDIVMDLVICFVTKMRSDFHDFEYACESLVSKEELKEKIMNNKEKFMTKEGFKIVSYFKVLNSFEYQEEKKYISILVKKIDEFNEKNQKTIDEIEREILTKLFI